MAFERRLDTFSLAALLVSAHYGLGFLLGTAEKSLTFGTAGSLYAVSLGLGTIALLGLAKFYWTQTEQIWNLLGSAYGDGVKIFVGLMSWSSLIGIEAVQLISGAFILKVFGIPTLPTMVVLAILFATISLLPVEKAGWILRGLLVVNFLALLYGLWVLHAFGDYLRSPFGGLSLQASPLTALAIAQSPIEFAGSVQHISLPSAVGVSLSTILLVLIDMKYQQFLVQAKDLQSLYKGCTLAAIILLLLAFLPSTLVVAAHNAGILPPGIDGKETLPFILSWIGGGSQKPLGIALILSLLVPALGIGSSILRVQTKTVLDFNILPASVWSRVLVTAANALFGLAVAFKGGEIVNLIVSFYAAYVGAVFVPFVTYLLAQTGRYNFSKTSVKLSLIVSSFAVIILLILTFIKPELALFGSVELNIMGTGILSGLLFLFMGEVLEKYLPTSKVREEA
jgi:SSS family solute:Na+ symporter